MVEDYVKRKHRQVPVKYMLPELQPILRKLTGHSISGTGHGIAVGLPASRWDKRMFSVGRWVRKAERWTNRKILLAERERGVSSHKAAELFNLIAKFAGYGFISLIPRPMALSLPNSIFEGQLSARVYGGLDDFGMGNTDKITDYINETSHGDKNSPPMLMSERTLR